MCEQPQSDDYILTPCGNLGGKTSVSANGKCLGEFVETDDALEFVRKDMDKNKYWPNIFWVSDHGNLWQIDNQGNEIT